jgi:hypothetical protein
MRADTVFGTELPKRVYRLKLCAIRLSGRSDVDFLVDEDHFQSCLFSWQS